MVCFVFFREVLIRDCTQQIINKSSQKINFKKKPIGFLTEHQNSRFYWQNRQQRKPQVHSCALTKLFYSNFAPSQIVETLQTTLFYRILSTNPFFIYYLSLSHSYNFLTLFLHVFQLSLLDTDRDRVKVKLINHYLFLLLTCRGRPVRACLRFDFYQ